MDQEEEDRLSNLPKTILHNILSKLPEEDAARTSVLSKAWADTWFTFPILSFNDFKREMTPYAAVEVDRMRDNFIDYVNRSLQRFSDRGLAIKKLKLVLNWFELHYMSKDVDRWLKLASERGVELLDLNISEGPEQDEEYQNQDEEYQIQNQVYTMPAGVIEAKSLTQLSLIGDIRVDPAFMNHSVKFFSLRVLTLWDVFLGDEKAIEHLISRCPLIEQITCKCCSMLGPDGGTRHLNEPENIRILKSLSMNCLPKLKGVAIEGIQEVYIDAPSLENLEYNHGDRDTPIKLDFDRCRNLRRLYLLRLERNTMITEKWFHELFPKFPFLESLKLDHCTMCERINISSDRLKVLELLHCYNLKEVNVDAPNLLSFDAASDSSKPMISFLRSSSQIVVNVLILIDYPDLRKFKEFIQNIKPQNVLASVSLHLVRRFMDPLNLDVLLDSSPPANIKHLNLRSMPHDDTLFSSLVNFLLSSCRPETISFSLHSFFVSRRFIEFFYETLMGKKEGICNCISGYTKCWWHGLNDVKFTSSLKIENNVDLKTFLESMPTSVPSDSVITFSLEY